MAHFQVIDDQWLLKNKPWLFPKGARLFVEGDAGVEKIHIHTGQTGFAWSWRVVPKTVRVRSTEDKNHGIRPLTANSDLR
ncbi:MAG: hypothetical protein IPK63_19610 [Candidatus Competibacteraceae bacterium]|nr:hypothetical protein [Candidatus Competibacteraceae bacterium]